MPSYPGELPRVEPDLLPPMPPRPQLIIDDDASAVSRGGEAGGFRGRATSTNSLPTIARSGGLPRTSSWSASGHASTLVGTPIARAGFLPDLEPLIMGSRSGVYLGGSRSTPEMSSSLDRGTLVNDPRASNGAFAGDGDGLGGGGAAALRLDAPLLHEPEGRRGACCVALQQGSVWGTAFNMCSATLGAGALALPYAVQVRATSGHPCSPMRTYGSLFSPVVTARFPPACMYSACHRNGL